MLRPLIECGLRIRSFLSYSYNHIWFHLWCNHQASPIDLDDPQSNWLQPASSACQHKSNARYGASIDLPPAFTDGAPSQPSLLFAVSEYDEAGQA